MFEGPLRSKLSDLSVGAFPFEVKVTRLHDEDYEMGVPERRQLPPLPGLPVPQNPPSAEWQ
eukprot:2471760-Amphidinium_carterae.1